MKYLSTRNTEETVGFKTALLAGLAPGGGLYVPTEWPQVSIGNTEKLQPYAKNAATLMQPYLGTDIPKVVLNKITEDAYAGFSHEEVAPLVQISEKHWLLQLFHGPTLSFKDFALQVLARLFDYVLDKSGDRLTIIGATSGDTGSAAIAACQGRPNLDIFILHPHGRISDVQRRQMTSVLADNVHNIAIEGTFDDCQEIVKSMLNDKPFRHDLRLAAINSINWARILAQVVYYHVAAARLKKEMPVFSVPTGNFGDVYAGYVAYRMGLPMKQLVVATNQNDIMTRVLTTGRYWLESVSPTITPSMDIQVASNFERLLFEIYDRNAKNVSECMNALSADGGFVIEPDRLNIVRSLFKSTAIDEATTLAEISKIHAETGYFVDPHTAVGVAAARALSSLDDYTIVSLATADPAKFPDSVERATGKRPALPTRLAEALASEEHYEVLTRDVETVKAYIRLRSRFTN